eukprot:1237128-Alexandrium_andersonii.AAC.1
MRAPAARLSGSPSRPAGATAGRRSWRSPWTAPPRGALRACPCPGPSSSGGGGRGPRTSRPSWRAAPAPSSRSALRDPAARVAGPGLMR